MNFKKWLLNEMPLTHLGVKTLPYYDGIRKLDKLDKDSQKYTSGYFSVADKAIIKAPKTERILKDKLKKVGYNINIILYESTDRLSNVTEEYKKNIENYMKENNLQKENHITFVKNSSSGDYLTPWMILHTLGHAVSDNEPKVKKLPGDYSGVRGRLEVNIEQCIKDYLDPNFDTNQLITRGDIKDSNLKTIFKFKSISSPKTIDFKEVAHELVAEYLWHGTIRTYGQNQLAECIVYKIREALDNCVGKIIFDWF